MTIFFALEFLLKASAMIRASGEKTMSRGWRRHANGACLRATLPGEFADRKTRKAFHIGGKVNHGVGVLISISAN